MNVWQKCPVCDGQGTVSKPPWVAGDQPTWVDTNTAPYPCRRCLGIGTIEQPEERGEKEREPYVPLNRDAGDWTERVARWLLSHGLTFAQQAPSEPCPLLSEGEGLRNLNPFVAMPCGEHFESYEEMVAHQRKHHAADGLPEQAGMREELEPQGAARSTIPQGNDLSLGASPALSPQGRREPPEVARLAAADAFEYTLRRAGLFPVPAGIWRALEAALCAAYAVDFPPERGEG